MQQTKSKIIFVIFFLATTLLVRDYFINNKIIVNKWNISALSFGDILSNFTLRVLGQVNLQETTLNRVSADSGFHLGGVHVDRAQYSDRIYIYDSGNNRILGFNEYPLGGFDTNADKIFGQSYAAERGACNKDNTTLADPSSSTLCLNRGVYSISQHEEARFGTMDTDENSNLYVLDQYNNRVLKYNNPYGSGSGEGDVIADAVWGQENFTLRACNEGAGFFRPTQSSLCTGETEWGNPFHAYGGGVDIDKDGNLWVADVINHRVLRFPDGSKKADLVIGQMDFVSALSDCGHSASTSKLCKPNTVGVKDTTGELYVIDQEEAGSARVLVFTPPFSNGMRASRVIGKSSNITDGIRWPRGLLFDPDTNYDIWVNDNGHKRLVLFDNSGKIVRVIGQNKIDLVTDYPLGNSAFNESRIYFSEGEIGLDSDDNIYISEDNIQKQVLRFQLPVPPPTETYLHPVNGRMIKKGWNVISENHLDSPNAVVAHNNQLFVVDTYRILAWNNYKDRDNGSPADFIIGPSDFQTNDRNDVFQDIATFMTVDSKRHVIWVASGKQILAFQLPITRNISSISDAAIVKRIHKELEGMRVYWKDGSDSVDLDFWGLAYDNKNDALWVTDMFKNKAVRISDAYTSRPVADLVIGQPDKINNSCNFEGRTSRSLCEPWDIKLDRLNNLYITEGGYEGGDNRRIIEFDEATLNRAVANGIFTLPSADRIYTKITFNDNNCIPGSPCNPMALNFDPDNKMIVVVDSYANKQNERIYVYTNPLVNNGYVAFNPSVGDMVDRTPMGQGGDVFFDEEGSLFIIDHTWNRLLYFKNTSIIPTNTPIASPTPPPLPGDANGDGLVNGLDFVVWITHFGQSTTRKNLDGDFDSSGIVQIADYFVWVKNY